MFVKDFMTAKVITTTEDTKVVDALDIMNEHNFHRLPIVRDGKLAGLVTEEIIGNRAPFTASSFRIQEMNYLLTKTVVGDIMATKVVTIGPDDLLEEAAARMRDKEVGVLPVVGVDSQVVGIITDKDIFSAFIELLGYNQKGSRIVLEIPEDQPGILEDITNILAEANIGIHQLAVYRKNSFTQLVIQMESEDTSGIKEILTTSGYTVRSAVYKEGENG